MPLYVKIMIVTSSINQYNCIVLSFDSLLYVKKICWSTKLRDLVDFPADDDNSCLLATYRLFASLLYILIESTPFCYISEPYSVD